MTDIHRAEIWLTTFSGSRGHEQKNERPAIIWRDLDHVRLAIAIPCTSKLERSKFPHTHIISPSLKNGFSQDSVALVFQITSIDKERLIKKIGELDSEDIESVSGLLKDLLRT
ncbi:MAG: type II toxin-antitoxin system PemK/MazF family toxin [Candidatus Micrarchaeota archaeon]|nr:type II toxin-antitoxin system PemK/MazF family toxin [Candidatus Micrarchaeota archaeon]